MKPTRRHLLILTAICAVAYFIGLTTHGITAWHEGQRLLVARQMLEDGRWLVPTINGHPYLAKPPLFYWMQMGLATLRGSSVTLLDTRLAVAIFGWLGVIVTYFAARDMLQPPGELEESRGREWTLRGAFWSAAMLATGIDYVRSSRIGELDMLLPALCTASIWMVFRAWKRHLEEGRTDWGACLLAVLAASLAGLAKGPPALVTVAIGAYGGVLLHAAWSDGALRVDAQSPGSSRGRAEAVLPSARSGRATLVAAFGGVAVALGFSVPQVAELKDAIGCVVGAALAGLAAGAVAPLVSATRARAVLAALSRTHPLLVLGLPLLVLYAWIGAVNARLDRGLLDAWASEEVRDNLRLFRPASSLSILEAASFGVGLGSIAFFGALAWLRRASPRLRPGWYMLLAWGVGGLIVFSLFGKGLARYVLPVWPAMAMVGGIGVAEALRVCRERRRRLVRGVLIAGTIGLTIAHAGWYGYGRAAMYAHRSPRGFVVGLLEPGLGVDPWRVVTFELYDPGIAYYLDVLSPVQTGRRTPRPQPVGDVQTRVNLTGMEPWPVERLVRAVARDGPCVVIMRETQPESRAERRSALERLTEAGFVATVLPVRGEYRLDGGRTRLLAVRVEVR